MSGIFKFQILFNTLNSKTCLKWETGLIIPHCNLEADTRSGMKLIRVYVKTFLKNRAVVNQFRDEKFIF